MLENMLGEALCKVCGPLKDLLERLNGKEGVKRLEELNQFLRGEVTQSQVEFLEYMIWKSRDAKTATKQFVVWLLRQTQRLAVPVIVYLPMSSANVELASDVHDMCSSSCTTNAGELFHLTGSPMYLDLGRPYRNEMYVAILNCNQHTNDCKKIEIDRSAISSVVCVDPWHLNDD